jgi:hypothetical protein
LTLFEKIRVHDVTFIYMTPKTQALAINFILDPTGTTSGSWVMGKPFVIPALHRNLHSKNFLVQKISCRKKF